MPTLNCNARYLYKLIGRTFSDLEFENLCFKFGLEVESSEIVGNEKLLKIDCPANRHDLLSCEGLAMALKNYLGIASFPKISLKIHKPLLSVAVSPNVAPIRPFISCAVLRNITFSKEGFDSFIDYQDKLHQSLCRKRSLASVGTHDLDKLTLPVKYDALPREDINFIPLKQTSMLSCKNDGLAKFYQNDKHIYPYVHLLSTFSKYPVVLDGDSRILSLPPIINSALTEVTTSTKNVFIECTGVDQNKVQILLNLIVSAFSLHCEEKFTVEAVEINRDGQASISPIFTETTFQCDVLSFARRIGMPMELVQDKGNLQELLGKMQLSVENENANENTITISAPISRPDILHECDIMEDVAIAYGYDKLVEDVKPVKTLGQGLQTKIGKLSKAIKSELASAGYCESLSFSLCSHAEAFENCLIVDDGKTAVHIQNPQTKEFQICRPSLLPGILKTVACNLKEPLPIRLFEVSDVMVKSNSNAIGAHNQHKVACLHAHSESSSFENIRGALDYLFEKLEIDKWYLECNGSKTSSYMNGRGAEICVETKAGPIYVGTMGVLHPQLLNNFGIPFPCAYFELSLEFLLES